MNDLGLRGCSPSARGIWADMLCLMHQGEPYGHLADKAGPLAMSFVAFRCGVAIRQLNSAVAELEARGVFSRTESGTIYSRRMVRDEYNRTVRAQGGQKSSKSPAVPKKKGILSSDREGYLPSAEVAPPFDPEEGEGRFSPPVEIYAKPENCQTAGFDPVPGWMRFKADYPPHRLNPHMDFGVWVGVVETIELQERVLSQLPRFKRSEQWLKDGGKFVPRADKFLGCREFEMEPGPEPSAIDTRNRQPEPVDAWSNA